MFIGHYAAALASKRIVPEASLGALILASVWIDLLWPVLLLLEVERVSIVPGITRVTPLDFVYYPFSHSLLSVFIWSIIFAASFFAWRRRLKPALVLGALVLSHWGLDALVHRPDLPLTFSGDGRVGLGLWDSVIGTIIVEGGLFAFGAAVYLRTTRAIDRKGRIGAWALILVMFFIYAGQFSGAAPPDVTVLAVTGLLQWLFVIFGYWVDRHRRALGKSEFIH